MTLQPENAQDCFRRFLQDSSSQKFHKSLERVKRACDAIEEMQGLLNYSRVAQYTENHYGSPKRQSIMNSKRLRLYIDLRKQEYAEKSPERPQKKKKTTGPQYPSADLDLKTRVYIDQLRAQNAFLEKAMNNLQQEILQETRRNPISLARAIETGPQDDLSLKIVHQKQGEHTDDNVKLLKKAVRKLLALAENSHCPLEFKKKNGKEFLALVIAHDTINTILFDDELLAIRILAE